MQDSIAILFRGNTIGTKIMMSYVRYSGKQYMQGTLGPLLSEIIELGDGIEVRALLLRLKLSVLKIASRETGGSE